MSHRIDMIQGSSIAAEVIAQARALAKGHERILVCLDSNHTHDHVLAELEGYAPLVSPGSYCVVFDTAIELSPPGMHSDRPWAPGDSPMTAVQSFLRALKERPVIAADGGRLSYEADSAIDHKLLISVAPNGFLKRVTNNE